MGLGFLGFFFLDFEVLSLSWFCVWVLGKIEFFRVSRLFVFGVRSLRARFFCVIEGRNTVESFFCKNNFFGFFFMVRESV